MRSPLSSASCPAICWILMTTNSAGLSGANPTRMLTMPRSMSLCVVVSSSHLTKYASLRRRALEGALAEQVVHERADVQADLRPERLVVGLEDDPLRCPGRALLDVQGRPAHGDVLPLARLLVGAVQRAGAPADVAEDREVAQRVDAERIEAAVLGVGQPDREASRRAARRRFPPAPSRRRASASVRA